MTDTPTIIYTKTDEAPALATYSFLPIIQAFTGHSGIAVELRDISLAGRILAVFPDYLRDDQKIGDALAELVNWPSNRKPISSSSTSAPGPQLKAAIAELQAKATLFRIP